MNGYNMEYAPIPMSNPPSSIFSFPRQSSRIQIRAPGEPAASEKQSQNLEPKLRSDAAAFTPSSQFFPSSSVSSEGQQQQETYSVDADAASGMDFASQAQTPEANGHDMMGYMPYTPNPYHYPSPDPYGIGSGYNPYEYVDMSQVAPYEMYPPPPQGTVYYR